MSSRLFYSLAWISLSQQPLCFISLEIDIEQKKNQNTQIKKKNNICLHEVISNDYLICKPANFFLPRHVMCLKNHIKFWEDGVDWGNSVPELH